MPPSYRGSIFAIGVWLAVIADFSSSYPGKEGTTTLLTFLIHRLRLPHIHNLEVLVALYRKAGVTLVVEVELND